MKNIAKVLILSSIAVLISALVVFSIVKAGSLTSPGTPSATMYTLEDIYQRLAAGTSAGSHSLAPAGAPASTMHDLSDIYGAIPTINAGEVCSGATYLGTSGTAVCGGGGSQQSYPADQTFIDNGDGTISDDSTHLMWAKDGNGAGCNNGNKLDFTAANSWALALDFAGYTDWRMPTKSELETIVDYSTALPAINALFSNTKGNYYWTSTYFAASAPLNAWSINFVGGISDWGDISAAYYVRAVRQY